MCKLKNRYSRDGFWFFGQLRKYAVVHAIFLFVAFLSANSAAALSIGQHDERCTQTNFYALEDDQDLTAAPVENREFRSGREQEESPNEPKLEIRIGIPRIEVTTLLRLPGHRSPSNTPVSPGISLCVTPFSPRPPPLFSAQA